MSPFGATSPKNAVLLNLKQFNAQFLERHIIWQFLCKISRLIEGTPNCTRIRSLGRVNGKRVFTGWSL
jgi:hypothetical protein